MHSIDFGRHGSQTRQVKARAFSNERYDITLCGAFATIGRPRRWDALRYPITVAGVVIACAVLAACGGGTSNDPTGSSSGTAAPATRTPNATWEATTLHLGVSELSEQKFRDAMEFILKNPLVREPNCATFLASSDLDAELAFEKNDRQSSHPPDLTPVVADQTRAGAVIKEICQRYAGTPTPTPVH